MGGTDQEDQHLSYYRPKVKTVHWPPKILIHFLSASVVNAWICFTDRLKLSRSTYTHLAFRKKIVEALTRQAIQYKEIKLEQYNALNSPPHLNSPPQQTYLRRNTWERKSTDRFNGEHHPVIAIIPREEGAGRRKKKITRQETRGRCMMCGLKTAIRCSKCSIFLCVDVGDNIHKNCWMFFHTEKYFGNFKRAPTKNVN